jgi:hypothetical protein
VWGEGGWGGRKEPKTKGHATKEPNKTGLDTTAPTTTGPELQEPMPKKPIVKTEVKKEAVTDGVASAAKKVAGDQHQNVEDKVVPQKLDLPRPRMSPLDVPSTSGPASGSNDVVAASTQDPNTGP